MKRLGFLALCAAWCAVTAAHAVTDDQRLLIFGASAPPQQPIPTGAQPQSGAYFNIDSSWTGGTTTNNVLTLPAGAMYVPTASVLNSWTVVFQARVEDNAQTPYSGSKPFVFAGHTGSSGTCASAGGVHCIAISSPGVSGTQARDAEILIGLSAGTGTDAWVPPGGLSNPTTGLNLTYGQTYTFFLSQHGADASGGATVGTMSLCVMDMTGALAGSGCVVTTTSNQNSAAAGLYYSAAATLRTQAAVGDIFASWGGGYPTTTNTNKDGTAGPIANAMMIWGDIPNTSGVPTLAVMQALATGAVDPATWATGASYYNGTLRSLYRFNNPGVWTGDAAGAVTAAATATGVGTITAGSPLVPNACLRPVEQGPGDVFRVTPGMSGAGATGTIYFNGSVNAAACGFTPIGIDAEILSGATPVAGGWHTIQRGKIGTTFSGSVGGVPAGGPYTFQLRPHNSVAYVYSSAYPIYVGMKVGLFGRSQFNYLLTSANNGGTNSTLAISTETASDVYMALTDSGASTTNKGLGHIGLFPLTPTTMPSGSTNTIGDGALEFIKDLSSLTGGWPIQVISFAKAGQDIDNWAYDYLAASANLTDTTGTYSASGATMLAGVVIANATLTSGFQTILHGSLKIKSGSTVLATDNSAGGFTSGSATVTGGAVNYLTGAITGLTFSGGDQGALTASWTSLQDTLAGSDAQQSPYVGYGVWGDGVTTLSGFTTQVASRMSGPLSMMIQEHAQGAEVNSINPPTDNSSGAFLSYATKLNYAYNKFALFPWWNANTPVLVDDYPRYPGGGLAFTGAMRQFNQNYVASGGNIKWGGSYYDVFVQCSNALCQSPHPWGGAGTGVTGTWTTFYGGQRWGQRMALFAYEAQAGVNTAAIEPTITGCAFVGGDYTKVVCTVNLPQGTSIATCGASMSSGNSGNGACSSTTANGTPVKGFQIGASATVMYNEYGEQWGSITAGQPAIVNGNTFACTIASATTVSCANTGTWSWSSGSTYINYMAGAPAGRSGIATGISIGTAGNTYTNNTYSNIAATGGGCTTEPKFNFTVSGGHFTAASRAAVGVGCTSAPTLAASAVGAGAGDGTAAFTITVQTAGNDIDDNGDDLYDNSDGPSSYFGSTAPGYNVKAAPAPFAVTG